MQRQQTVIAAEQPEHHQQQLIQVSIPRGILSLRASSADRNCDIEGRALRRGLAIQETILLRQYSIHSRHDHSVRGMENNFE